MIWDDRGPTSSMKLDACDPRCSALAGRSPGRRRCGARRARAGARERRPDPSLDAGRWKRLTDDLGGRAHRREAGRDDGAHRRGRLARARQDRDVTRVAPPGGDAKALRAAPKATATRHGGRGGDLVSRGDRGRRTAKGAGEDV